MRKTLLAILFVCMLFTAGATADEKDLYIDKNVQRVFTSEDGLLSTSTQAVAQTRDGFIWIGGYGGLVRYDGKRFETFAYKQITRVSDLAAGEDGSLWVATSDKGLFKYRDGAFERIPSEDETPRGVECMAFAPDGTLYLGTASGLCAVVDGRIAELPVEALRDERIDRLLCPAPGVILCLTRSGVLFTCDGETARSVPVGEDCVLRSITWDAEAGVYLAGTAGSEVLIFDADLNRIETLPMEGLSCINDLRMDAGGVLWLCADNGIAIYVDHSVRMQNLRMNNSVDRMLVDREGNHWFVSSRQGVLKVSRSRFGDVSQSAGLEPMVVNAIQRIGDTLYIGHDAGLRAIGAADYRAVEDPVIATLDGVRVRALVADSRGDLWIGTMKKGLMRYTPGGALTEYTTRTHPALKSNNIRAIQETEDGMLIGTDVGAYTVSGDAVTPVVDGPDALSFRILSARQLGDTVYLGTDGNGLYLVRDGQLVRRVTTEDGLSSDVIMKVCRSAAYDGTWLVTGNNLDFLSDSGEVTSIDSFPSTNNLDLLLMEGGEAWVLTGVGIYRTTEASLLEDDAPRYVQFRAPDGLPYEITPNAYAYRSGPELYVCGSGGVFTLQTDFSDTESGEYMLAVDSLVVDGETVYVRHGAPVELDADVKRVDINANVLTYQTGNPFVTYWLEGFDDTRTNTRLSDLGGISYTNLNGGAYTFHFGIVDYRTGEIVQSLVLPIVKRFSWYQYPWVRFAGLALGAVLVALVTLELMRRRARRAQRLMAVEFARKEKEHLERIAYRDYLTGLYNRNYLDVWNARPPQPDDFPISFVSIDMNDLKRINDQYGHKDGDQLLNEMAALLRRHFSAPDCAVFRIGGDEFLILAARMDRDAMQAALDRMAAEGRAILVHGIPVTFEAGICTQTAGDFSFEDGLRLSDLEMLENKDRYHGRQ